MTWLFVGSVGLIVWLAAGCVAFRRTTADIHSRFPWSITPRAELARCLCWGPITLLGMRSTAKALAKKAAPERSALQLL